MSAPDLTRTEAKVLQAVHAEGSADLYDLAQSVGAGPRSVQEVVRGLSQDGLVYVSDRGRRVCCTRAGDEVARSQQ